MPQEYSFKVSIRGPSPMVWRRLRVSSETSVVALHYILQICFDWDDYFLHRFHIFGKDFGIGRSGCNGFPDNAFDVRLSQFAFDVGDRFTYEYNYYMNRTLDIRLEAIQPQSHRRKTPFCLSGQGIPEESVQEINDRRCELLERIEEDEESFTADEFKRCILDIQVAHPEKIGSKTATSRNRWPKKSNLRASFAVSKWAWKTSLKR